MFKDRVLAQKVDMGFFEGEELKGWRKAFAPPPKLANTYMHLIFVEREFFFFFSSFPLGFPRRKKN